MNDSRGERLFCFLSWMKHLYLDLLWTLEPATFTHAMLLHYRRTCRLSVTKYSTAQGRDLGQVKVWLSQHKALCGALQVCELLELCMYTLLFSFCNF